MSKMLNNISPHTHGTQPCCLYVCLQLPLDQREGIPHHLIDILDPADEFSAGDFHKLGRQAAENIIAVGCSNCADS
jgi:hypothetical protein